MGSHRDRGLLPFLGPVLGIALTVGGCATSPADPISLEVPEDPTPPSSEAAATDSTTVESPPPIRVKISDEERSKLMEQIGADLQTATDRASSRPDPAQLTPEQRQRWDTLDQYIELAQTSWDSGDIRSAADLALKARLLAEELAPR